MSVQNLGLVLLASLMVSSTPALAGDVQVAVAANFTEPARDIAQAFQARTGHTVTMSIGPSGSFYAQIKQGAPFEVLLSADAERPTRLEAEGHGVKGTRFVYAYGALVLWSAKPGPSPLERLRQGRFDHIAIADPASAPYGVAAVETLKKLGLYDKVATKIVKGSSIAQAHSFVATGAAQMGFVALSQVHRDTKGARWVVPKDHYSPIDQQAILLTPGRDDPAARAYLDFLKSPEAVKIITSYGYAVR